MGQSKNYLLMCDPLLYKIPTKENGDPLVSLLGYHENILLDSLLRPKPSSDFTMRLRLGAAKKLLIAAQKLPVGYCLLLKETLRSAALQEVYFEYSVSRARGLDLSGCEQRILAAASRYTAPPQVAGHPTGGAIDLTLASSDGLELDLGCKYDEDEVKSNGRCFSEARNITREAKYFRKILFDVLIEAGFVNYPFEWWHWSYGDKYWAAITGSSHAIYDVALN
jgi:D-alanyl-D-alanine dipeptidase